MNWPLLSDNHAQSGPSSSPPGSQDESSIAQDGLQISVWTVFFVFLKLGLTSFGGPVAHIGYFRNDFVERR